MVTKNKTGFTGQPEFSGNEVEFGHRDENGKGMVFTNLALNADDQLRQRVAWSLSQIYIVAVGDIPEARDDGRAGRVRLITVRACTFPRRGRIKSRRLTHSPFPSPILRSFPSPFEDTSSRVSPYVSLSRAGTRVRTNLSSLN